MTQHEKLFESLPPTRLFFRCALPSMISMAMLSLYTVADGIFVGRYVGPNALAAVNLVMPLIMMSFALVDLVAVGSSVQISIRLGEKNERAANRIFSFCTGLIVALSCVIGLGGFFLAGPMVSLMGAEAEVTAMGAGVYAGICRIRASHYGILCSGQLSAHLRPGAVQHDTQCGYSTVEHRAGFSIFGSFPLGGGRGSGRPPV